jgi:pimeloyl-ACP methyl ester carboxylesterase
VGRVAAKEREVVAGDGRRLRIVEDGVATGPGVFMLHGSPGSRFLYAKHVQDARSVGIRLIGYDRAGYGESSARPGRRVVDEASDVAAIADVLGVERFGVWGFSGGGPLALACAAKLPHRVVGAASIGGPAPFTADGLDWSRGMGEANIEEMRLLREDRPGWERRVAEECAELARADLAQLVQTMATLLSDADRAAMQGELGRHFHRIMTGGLQRGGDGYRDDGLAQAAPWGFEVGSIRVPTQIWQGGQDRFVPFAHGEWLAARIPGTDAHLLPAEGHISLYARAVPPVHRWLAARF